MKLTKRPSWALGALAAGASIAVTIGLATPARAALSGTDWTSVPLSDGVTQGIADGPAVHPVSCVSGTTFCDSAGVTVLVRAHQQAHVLALRLDTLERVPGLGGDLGIGHFADESQFRVLPRAQLGVDILNVLEETVSGHRPDRAVQQPRDFFIGPGAHQALFGHSHVQGD